MSVDLEPQIGQQEFMRSTMAALHMAALHVSAPGTTADICPVSTADMSSVARADICVVSTHSVDVSEVSIVAMSQCSSLRSLNCGNVTMFKSQKVGPAPNHQKWPEMGPEWSPGPENRPPGMPRPFSRLWDRSRGPGRPQVGPESAQDACGMTAIIPQVWDDSPVRLDLSSHIKQRYARADFAPVFLTAAPPCVFTRNL